MKLNHLVKLQRYVFEYCFNSDPSSNLEQMYKHLVTTQGIRYPTDLEPIGTRYVKISQISTGKPYQTCIEVIVDLAHRSDLRCHIIDQAAAQLKNQILNELKNKFF